MSTTEVRYVSSLDEAGKLVQAGEDVAVDLGWATPERLVGLEKPRGEATSNREVPRGNNQDHWNQTIGEASLSQILFKTNTLRNMKQNLPTSFLLSGAVMVKTTELRPAQLYATVMKIYEELKRRDSISPEEAAKLIIAAETLHVRLCKTTCHYGSCPHVSISSSFCTKSAIESIRELIESCLGFSMDYEYNPDEDSYIVYSWTRSDVRFRIRRDEVEQLVTELVQSTT